PNVDPVAPRAVLRLQLGAEALRLGSVGLAGTFRQHQEHGALRTFGGRGAYGIATGNSSGPDPSSTRPQSGPGPRLASAQPGLGGSVRLVAPPTMTGLR